MNNIKFPAFYEEIAKHSHTLIAGATGSGKSVIINDFITYLILEKIPRQAELVLVDPKRVELSKFKKCAHTSAHATEPEEIVKAFTNAEKAMDSRYRVLEKKGLTKWPGGAVYVIVDEFIEIAGLPIQRQLKRIATLGRAAKIHLIIATQRPSISDRLIPAVLKANFDCTLCLRCKEPKDSRLICGLPGADRFPNPAEVGYAELYLCIPGENRHIKFYGMDPAAVKAIVREKSNLFYRLKNSKIAI